jgi:hypothetical protein
LNSSLKLIPKIPLFASLANSISPKPSSPPSVLDKIRPSLTSNAAQDARPKDGRSDGLDLVLSVSHINTAQLSKDEEASTPDAEVTREDQDKINAFSRLHNREKKYEEELERKQVCLIYLFPTYPFNFDLASFYPFSLAYVQLF